MKLRLLVSMTLTLGLLSVAAAYAADTRCPGVIIEANPRGPDAAAKMGRMTLRPRFMRRYSEKVQLFITYHECAHATGQALGQRRVKDDEILADKIAFERAFAEGWMDAATVDDVCKSWGRDPETQDHPSARRRCAQLRRWFAAAQAKKATS